MIVTLLLSLFGFAAAMLFIMVIAPFTCWGEFSISKSRRSGLVRLHWLHPRIAALSYDIGTGTRVLTIAGWTRMIPPKPAAGEEKSGMPPDDSGSASEIRPPSGDYSRGEGVGSSPSQNESIDRHGRAPETSRDNGPGRETRAPGVLTGGVKRPEPPSAPSNGRKDSGHGFSFRKFKQSISLLRKRRLPGKLLRWTLRTLHVTLHLIRFDCFRLHATGGLDDPAETGKLFGWYTAAKNGLGKQKNVEIRFEPRFFDSAVACEGAVAVTTSIARTLTPLIVAALTFPYLSTFLAWRGLRKVYKR